MYLSVGGYGGTLISLSGQGLETPGFDVSTILTASSTTLLSTTLPPGLFFATRTTLDELLLEALPSARSARRDIPTLHHPVVLTAKTGPLESVEFSQEVEGGGEIPTKEGLAALYFGWDLLEDPLSLWKHCRVGLFRTRLSPVVVFIRRRNLIGLLIYEVVGSNCAESCAALTLTIGPVFSSLRDRDGSETPLERARLTGNKACEALLDFGSRVPQHLEEALIILEKSPAPVHLRALCTHVLWAMLMDPCQSKVVNCRFMETMEDICELLEYIFQKVEDVLPPGPPLDEIRSFLLQKEDRFSLVHMWISDCLSLLIGSSDELQQILIRAQEAIRRALSFGSSDPGSKFHPDVVSRFMLFQREQLQYVLSKHKENKPIAWSMCINCGGPADLSCESCRSISYCSPQCQKEDWKGTVMVCDGEEHQIAGHKEECRKFREGRESLAKGRCTGHMEALFQPAWQCAQCGLNKVAADNKDAICQSCMLRCHAGHQGVVRLANVVKMTCDCHLTGKCCLNK